jgi:hypothetical protein
MNRALVAGRTPGGQNLLPSMSNLRQQISRENCCVHDKAKKISC